MPTILVVDDSLSVRKVAERMLTEAGLTVALAANGEEALTWMTANRPDLVIADVIMPDKSGFEVCAYVRAQANLADTPVLLVSGFVDDEVTRQAEACRAEGVVKKPFQGASLRERVLELLAARKAPAAPAPEPVLELALAEPVIEMPAMAPAPAIAFPAPVAAPPPLVMAAPAPVAAPPALVVPAAPAGDEVRALRETVQKLEGRVEEQEKALAQFGQQWQAFRESTSQAFKDLEHQLQTFRDNAARALVQVQGLEGRLAEEEKQSADLRKRLADLEPAAVSAKQLLQALTDFARQVLKAGEGGKQ